MAALKAVLPDDVSAEEHLYLALEYHDDIELASKLCTEFIGDEVKNIELTKTTYEVSLKLKDALSAFQFILLHIPQAADLKVQLTSVLADAERVASDKDARSKMQQDMDDELKRLENAEKNARISHDLHRANDLHQELQKYKTDSDQRLKDFDKDVRAVAELKARIYARLSREPHWPRHESLIRFDCPLQKRTSQFVMFKKWVPRFFSLRGSRLYYTNGKFGFSNNREGTLKFIESGPAPDGHFCIDLSGMYVLFSMLLVANCRTT